MRFQVPQFIEVEDKIFGPLTFKQFVYLAGAVGVGIVVFTFLPRLIAILIILPVATLAGALAFYKINNKPFINVVEAFFKYTLGGKLYIWRKEERPIKDKEATNKTTSYVPRLTDSKLKDLTWTLDVKENVNPTVGPEEKVVNQSQELGIKN